MYNHELDADIALVRYHERIAAAAHERFVAAVREPRATLGRRAAGPLGRALLRLGAGLLRYSKSETTATTHAYRAPASSPHLN